MTTDAPDRLERLFRAARLHPSEEQAAFLDAACPDDAALRAEVEGLLALDAEADDDGFLGRPATGLLGGLPAPPASEPSADPLVGQSVGPYRVLRALGAGGMGAVYLAVREVPFVRYVALKVVRGLASADALGRFEQERQILAGLDHPGIARLLDGGVTDPVPGSPGGLPYFAMEYVEGRPITDYADDHRLSVDDRLALFEQVCAAVHLAHQNLVLHRDLKPSNILVTADGGPQGIPRVKLLDFGIAKLLNPTLGPAAMPVTQTALRPLTPEYASPEQVRGEGLTTASDVYGLGVVLYELLTGRRPYQIARRTPVEVARAVAEADPERPSTRVGRDEGDAATATETARQRDTTPDRLRRALRGDLDTIVLTALRKEPQRRYPSAEALALDLDRHRRGLPVRAHRDSRAYRLGKLVRRHPAETALVAVVLAAVVGFAAYSQWQAGRVEAERDRAEAARTEAAAVSSFLVGLFERADPTAAPGDSVTVRELLDDGAARVEAELAGLPAAQAGVLDAVARAYQNFGRPSDALPLLKRALALRREALGPDHPETAVSVLALADAYSAAHDVEPVEGLLREHLQIVERAHGPESLEAAEALGRLVPLLAITGRDDEAKALAARWQRVLDGLSGDSEALGTALTALGSYLALDDAPPGDALGVLDRAAEVGRRAAGDTSAVVAAALFERTGVLLRADRVADAERTARRVVAVRRALYPDGHADLAAALEFQGEAALAQSRPAEAEALLREALAIRRQVHPPTHPTTARALVRLGDLVAEARRDAEAAALYRAAVDAYAATFGPDVSMVRDLRAKLAALGE